MKLIRNSKKSKEFNKVNKCPKCGAIIDLTTGICPDCKYEMPEFSDNTIVEKLSKRINRAKMMPLPNMFEVNAVEKFPIPSNRQDLLAVMAFINSKVKIMVAEGLYDKHRVITTYFRKLQECTVKSQILYPGDSAFDVFTCDYNAYLEAREEAMKKARKQTIRTVTILVLTMLLPFVIFGILAILDYFDYISIWDF